MRLSYKNYLKLFESIKQSAKSQYYLKMILHYKDNIKKNMANHEERDWHKQTCD